MQYSYQSNVGKKGDIVSEGVVYGSTGKFSCLKGRFEVIKGLHNARYLVIFEK
jgi:hypothetical protein